MFEWIYNILTYLGLYNKKAKILFLGLDNAGKTTLLRVMKENKIAIHEPTMHPNSEKFIIGNIEFTTFDLGGHESARRLWKDYSVGIDGIVFIVDSSDISRLTDAKKELQNLLTNINLDEVPILVLGNKIDIRNALSEYDLRFKLDLSITSGKNNWDINYNQRPLEVFMCSVIKKKGYIDGFKWLSKFI